MNAPARVRTYTALLILLVALFVAGVVFGPRRGQVLGLVFPGLDSALVDGIEVSSDIVIEREGESWVLDEGSRHFPARTDRVQSLLDELKTAALVRHVTGNQNLWPDFGLTDEAGTPLTIRFATDDGAQTARRVVWGASAAEARLSYLRVGDSSDVYASDGEVQFYLRQPASYWSYLRLLPEDVTTPEVIALSSWVDVLLSEDEHLTLAYDLERQVAPAGEQWIGTDTSAGAQVEGGAGPEGRERPLDSNAVSGMLRDVVDLVGTDFSRQPRFDPLPVVGVMTLALADGREFQIEIVQSGEIFICRGVGPELPGDPFGGLAYELSGAKVRRLFPQLTTLLSD